MIKCQTITESICKIIDLYEILFTWITFDELRPIVAAEALVCAVRYIKLPLQLKFSVCIYIYIIYNRNLSRWWKVVRNLTSNQVQKCPSHSQRYTKNREGENIIHDRINYNGKQLFQRWSNISQTPNVFPGTINDEILAWITFTIITILTGKKAGTRIKYTVKLLC